MSEIFTFKTGYRIKYRTYYPEVDTYVWHILYVAGNDETQAVQDGKDYLEQIGGEHIIVMPEQSVSQIELITKL